MLNLSYHTSLRMRTSANPGPHHELATDLAQALGARRTARLRTLMRQTSLPAEVLLDLAIELVDIASRKLSPPPITRTAVGLGAARWRNVSAEERSRLLRLVVQARWRKYRKNSR